MWKTSIEERTHVLTTRRGGWFITGSDDITAEYRQNTAKMLLPTPPCTSLSTHFSSFKSRQAMLQLNKCCMKEISLQNELDGKIA
jgi:hypothetical protein